MDIKYKIKFYNDWHCGSGLAAGADVDLLVIKDKNRLPFVPGKTVKGLVREAMEEITTFTKSDENLITKLFGKENTIKDDENGSISDSGELFFTNATLEKSVEKEIIESGSADYLYRSIASTAIGKDGIAKSHSLRRMEVTIPCDLFGEIHKVPSKYKNDIQRALKYIKRLGQNRNRGLGRCDIILLEKGGEA